MKIKKILLLWFPAFAGMTAFASLTAFAAPKAEVANIVEGSASKAYKYTYKNGLKLIVVPDYRNPIATLHFILNAGSDTESLGTTGLAHFFEHNMFRKAQGAPEGNYDRILNSIGGSGNAGTSDSFVTFYTNFPSPAIDTMLKLEADRFTALDIAEPYFSIEKGAVISERKMRVENDVMARNEEIIRSQTERDTPLEWMVIGSKKDVEEMKLESAKEFYKDFYTPDNTTLVVGGPFSPQDIYNKVEKYFGSWQGKASQKRFHYPPSYFTRDLKKSFIVKAPVEIQNYELIYPSPNKSLQTSIYVSVLQALLDDDTDGRLNRRFVKNKLASEFYFYQRYWQNGNTPYIAGFILNKNQNFEKAKAFWLENLKKIFSKKITAKIKNQILKQMAVSNADTANRMTSLVSTALENEFFLNDFYAANKFSKIVKELDEQKFRNWLKNVLNENNYYTTGIAQQESK